MSTLFLIFPWVLGLIAIGAFVKICVSASGQSCMVFRIFTASLVVSFVFSVCYYAWFLTIENLVPPEFGMPAYEDEIELAFVVGSVTFSVVPLLISIGASAFLKRHFLMRHLGSDDLIPVSSDVTGGTRD